MLLAMPWLLAGCIAHSWVLHEAEHQVLAPVELRILPFEAALPLGHAGLPRDAGTWAQELRSAISSTPGIAVVEGGAAYELQITVLDFASHPWWRRWPGARVVFANRFACFAQLSRAGEEPALLESNVWIRGFVQGHRWHRERVWQELRGLVAEALQVEG